MTNATAPPITPCPVDWCPEAGRHEWRQTAPPPWGGGDGYRFHRVETLIRIGDEDTPAHAALTVSAEVFEAERTTEESVQIMVDHMRGEPIVLRSREAVEDVVFALQDAADLVFPEPPVELCVAPEDEAEFDAALQEVIDRAEHPIDFNRLVSATIRLRGAYLRCAG